MASSPSSASFAEQVAEGERFEFGENWRRFLEVLDEARITEAETALRRMVGGDLAGLSFLDIGSGSGLSSLAAARLGATRIHSFDFDPDSVWCTKELRQRHGLEGGNWTVERASALDADYFGLLGRFDVVYSWGVLHHTGAMWSGLENAAAAVELGGTLFIALYNDQGGLSRLWRVVKRFYNRLPSALRLPYAVAVMAPREVRSAAKTLLSGRPRLYLRRWTGGRRRGMSRWHDLIDWVGGYPFEVATPEAVLDFLRPRGFELVRMTTCGGGLGCNQYVFTRSDR